MTIGSDNRRSGPYTANGSTTVFQYTFKISDASHIQVVQTISGVDTVLTTGFTVSGVGSNSGGDVTFTTAPTSGTITLLLNVPFTQLSDYRNQANVPPENIEDDLDLAVQRDLSSKVESDRTIRVGLSETGFTIDGASDRAGKYLGFDGSGNPISSSGPTVSDIPYFSTKALFELGNIDSGVSTVWLAGYSVAGDRGDGVYVRQTSEPSHSGKIQSADGAWWALMQPERGYRPQQFGAKGDGATDDATALAACFQTAVDRSIVRAFGTGSNNIFTTGMVDLGDADYLVGSKVTIDNSKNLEVHGQNAIIRSDGTITDFTLEFTTGVAKHDWHHVVFESSDQGCIKINATNISTRRVAYHGCTFKTDDDSVNNAIAVDYTNRSSLLLFDECYFDGVKHPVHNKAGDFVTFTNNCWFAFPSNSSYSDRDGYIRIDTGFCTIEHCLFAGGPAWYTGKTDADGNAITQYHDVAFVICGIENAAPSGGPGDHARISINNCRIAFEDGAGALVNYFVEHKGNAGSDFRSGIILNDIQCSPREDKNTALDGVSVANLINLAEMPHQISLKNVHSSLGEMSIINVLTAASWSGAGSPSFDKLIDLTEELDFKTDPANQMNPKSTNNLQLDNVTGGNIHMTAATTAAENRRWLRAFDAGGFFFDSDFPDDDSSGDNPTVIVETDYEDFSSDRRGCLFWIEGGVMGDVSSGNETELPIAGWVIVMRDETTTDTLYVTFQSALNHTGPTPAGVQVTPKFDVSGTKTTSIATSNAASAKLIIELQSAGTPGTDDIRCLGLICKPASSMWPRNLGLGTIHQSYE